MSTVLRVSLNETPIGTVTLLPSSGIFFAFDEDFLNKKNKLVLSQSFFKQNGELIPETKVSSAKLPPFFANLLPEGHMREYIAQRGNIKPSQEFKLLEFLGHDLPGAVIVTPLEGMGASEFHTHHQEHNEGNSYRFSLAGVQLKFSAIAGSRGGLTIPAQGVGGNWIIKLPAQNYAHVPENEYAMMQLAARIGIPVPEIKLISLDEIAGLPEMGLLIGKKALAVKRFDRTQHGQRIHMEDFAQVYNIYPQKKYEGVSFANVTGMIWSLCGEQGLTDFIRRLTFTILTGNGDMHLKNWSFIYEDGITPSLSPAYDMVSTIPYIPEDKLALQLADTKDMKSISMAHFKKLVDKAQVPEYMVIKTVRETVEVTREVWAGEAQHFGLPKEIGEAIQRHMDSVNLSFLT